MKEWREYARQHVVAETDERKLRKTRLLNANNTRLEVAWKSLAHDVLPQSFITSDGVPYVIEWKEALAQVMGTLIFPPSLIDPTPFSKAQKAAQELRAALAKVGWNLDSLDEVLRLYPIERQPLLAGKSAGRDFERNWLALYLRERVIRAFFCKPHHADIALLVSIAIDAEITADQVRLLKPRNNYRP